MPSTILCRLRTCGFRSVQIPACLLSITLSTLHWESALGLKELSLQSRAWHFDWVILPPCTQTPSSPSWFHRSDGKGGPHVGCQAELITWLFVGYFPTTWNKGLYITGYLWYIGNITKKKLPYTFSVKNQHWFPAPHVINSWISGLAHMFQWFLWEGAMYNDKILPDYRLHFIAVRKSNIKKSTCFLARSSIQLG